MRSGFMEINEFEHVLAALMPANRLACEVSACTGLRIGDVLNLRSARLCERFTVRELKTGKTRRVTLPRDLLDRLIAQSGKIFVFEGRENYRKPRTRQAVYKDLTRAAKLFRIRGTHISPHSARKIYAVGEYRRTGSLQRVKELLNHSDEAVTMLYAMADELSARRAGKK
ncbi:MAG: tyrosine-type recombinase/integrase [bacterium]